MEKLAALVPPPRAHIIRYHGVFAPHAKARSKIVPRDTKKQMEGENPTDRDLKKRDRMSWAKLLNRVFQIDLTKCHFCKGEIRIVSAVIEKEAIGRILNHLGIPSIPPTISPARPPPQIAFKIN